MKKELSKKFECFFWLQLAEPKRSYSMKVLIQTKVAAFFLFPLFFFFPFFPFPSFRGEKPAAAFFFQSCWPTRDHIGRSTGISNPAWHLPQVVPRVVQTTGSVFALPAYTAQLPTRHQHRANNQWIGRQIKSSRLWGLAATLRQHSN